MEFIKTLLIACIPAIITGLVTYLVARKNATSQIDIVKEQNKHDLEKLMEQHKIDIDHLKEAHKLEMESKEQDHKNKLELIAKENENNINQNLINGLINEALKFPEVKEEIANGIRQSSNKKKGKR